MNQLVRYIVVAGEQSGEGSGEHDGDPQVRPRLLEERERRGSEHDVSQRPQSKDDDVRALGQLGNNVGSA